MRSGSVLNVVCVPRSLVAFVVPALAGIALLLTAPLSGRDQARNRATRLVGRWGCALAGIRLEIHDPDGHAGLRPAVVVFNHASGVDPVILCRVLKRDLVGVAKRELRRHPLLGPLLHLGGTVFVQRDAGTGAAQLDAAGPALARGLAVAIAPAGHRSRTPGRLRPGALALARRAGVPILPVIIHGSAGILPPGDLVMRAGRVRVDVLAPRDPRTLTLEGLEALFHEER